MDDSIYVYINIVKVCLVVVLICFCGFCYRCTIGYVHSQNESEVLHEQSLEANVVNASVKDNNINSNNVVSISLNITSSSIFKAFSVIASSIALLLYIFSRRYIRKLKAANRAISKVK